MLSVIKNTANRMRNTKSKSETKKMSISKNVIEEFESLKKINITKKSDKLSSNVELNLVADEIVIKGTEVARKLGINCSYEIRNYYNNRHTLAEVDFILVEQIGIFSFAKFSEYLETQIPSFISSSSKEPGSYLTECSVNEEDNKIKIMITKV